MKFFKKILWLFLAIGMVMSLPVCAQGQERFSKQAEIFFPSFGWAFYDDAQQVTGYGGVNLLLGFSGKKYFKPLQTGAWNGFIGLDTFFVVLPLASVGAVY